VLIKEGRNYLKLMDIPRGSKIYCTASDGSKYLTFNHLDGMYSHCTTEAGGTAHLGVWTPLAPHLDGYEICDKGEPESNGDDE
jgi:hypothetical protein